MGRAGRPRIGIREKDQAAIEPVANDFFEGCLAIGLRQELRVGPADGVEVPLSDSDCVGLGKVQFALTSMVTSGAG